MGCSTSKLDDEEAVQLCKDRKSFVKQAVEQRNRFASGHVAYIQSMKRVSAALRDYVVGDEPHALLLDSFITPPPFTPVKKASPGFISISPKSFSPAMIEHKPNSRVKVHYSRSGVSEAVSVEERPPSPESYRVEAYSPRHQFGFDGFFNMQSSPMNSSFYSSYPSERPSIPPPSPQTSQWDFFWNPFSSLDYYGYPSRTSLDHTVLEDESRDLRQVREAEGIPDLEEDDSEHEKCERNVNPTNGRVKIDANCMSEEVIVEDVDESEEEDDEETCCGSDTEHEPKDLQSQGRTSMEVLHAQTSGQVEASDKEMVADDHEAREETPGFTVYVNRRPTSMGEVINDLEAQFTMVYNAASEVSALLEASKATPAPNETAMKMLNPVALLRSASSRSTSSRFLMNSSSSREQGYESSSDMSDKACIFHGSHQSTLDRLYAWEKKLYQEVRSGEKVRIAYEKKYMQLRNQDVKGHDPNSVDKTRTSIRDLHTQIKVSIHTIEAISKRIEALRDEELQPQLLELLQGLAKMWKVMAECHQMQKRTLEEAKLLLAGTPSKLEQKRRSSMLFTDHHRLGRSAANLEAELRNWRACFESWITSQRSYVQALAGWLLRCLRCEPDTSKLPFSPRRSSGSLPIYGLCVQWSRSLDPLCETPVLDGLDFFAAGMGSIYAQLLKDDSRQALARSKSFGAGISDKPVGDMDLVEINELQEEVFSAERLAEVSIKVLCAGMSVAVASLSKFSIDSAEVYAELIGQWTISKLQPQGAET